MKIKKESIQWPAAYEPPRIHHIETAFQQALGITACSSGIDAAGGSGSCSMGTDATGTPGEPNACAPGASAMVGPGHGSSPCGPGHSASA
jgi:hypothetical protein